MKTNNDSSNNPRAASTNAVVDALDQGSANASARLLFYSGAQPSTAAGAATGTLIATLNFANPAYASSNSSGVADLAGGTALSGTVTSSGTVAAGYARAVDRDNVCVFQFSVGTSGTDIVLDGVNCTNGATLTISSLAISTPME